MKKTEETDYNSFLLNRHLKALPTIPVSESSKDLILSNILRTKKKKTKTMRNILELLKPTTYVAAMIFMFLLINANYGIIPLDSSDGFYVSIESEVKGAEIYINDEHQGVTPFSKKIEQGSNIKISKDGYIEWTGEFSGDSLEEALESFESPENYRLLRGNNSLKIVAELMPIKKDTIYLETDIPGATVKNNGEIVGLTPTSIKLASTNNYIEITKDQIEKIYLELLYDGEIDVVGENLIEISRRGYNINLITESLYYPQETHWLDENKLFIFEVNNDQFRGKVLDFDSGQLGVFHVKDLSEFQIYNSNEEEVIFGQRVFLRQQETLEVRKRMYLSEENQLIVDDNGVYVQVNDKLQNFHIETSNSAKLIRAIGNMVYYQIDNLLYKYDLNTNMKELITDEIEPAITDLAKNSNGLAIVAGGEVFMLVEGELSKIPFFTNVQHITLKDQELIIFNYEKYVTIWTYHMEKESMSKIY